MSIDEANKLLTISQEYLPNDKLKELIFRLENESTTNDFKQSLKTMRLLLDPPAPPPKWLWASFYILVVAHYLLVCGIVTSFFTLPFMASWYIALPCMTFIWFFSTSRVECKLTQLENYLRKKLGMKQIGGFVGHYFKKPIFKLWKRFK
jgi:hypothetical protein